MTSEFSSSWPETLRFMRCKLAAAYSRADISSHNSMEKWHYGPGERIVQAEEHLREDKPARIRISQWSGLLAGQVRRLRGRFRWLIAAVTLQSSAQES